jgi:hypothetical protein
VDNNHSLGAGFGVNAGHCGVASYGHGTAACKDGCGRRVLLGAFGGYCPVCAPNHGIQPIRLGPEAITLPAATEPKQSGSAAGK